MQLLFKQKNRIKVIGISLLFFEFTIPAFIFFF